MSGSRKKTVKTKELKVNRRSQQNKDSNNNSNFQLNEYDLLEAAEELDLHPLFSDHETLSAIKLRIKKQSLSKGRILSLEFSQVSCKNQQFLVGMLKEQMEW